jgi:hypothetical protein
MGKAVVGARVALASDEQGCFVCQLMWSDYGAMGYDEVLTDASPIQASPRGGGADS